MIKRIIIFVMTLSIAILGTACDAKSEGENVQNSENRPVESVENTLWRPTGAVNLIVPSNAGGGHDTAARVFAKMTEEVTGVKMNIINNGAGGGAVAFAETMNAKPDGMTVGQLGSGLATDQYTVDGCEYTPESYRYIGIHSGDDIHLVVNSKGPFSNMSVSEFLEHAKTNKLTVACSGTWGQADTSRYLIEEAADVSFQRVGIKGGANCALAVVAGDVDAALVFPSEISAQVDAGNLKVLAHLGEERNDFFPEAPTFIEEGYDITFPAFKVLALPLDTPDDIYEGWCAIFDEVMAADETAKAFLDVGVTYKNISGNESYNYVMETHDLVKDIIDSGVMEAELK